MKRCFYRRIKFLALYLYLTLALGLSTAAYASTEYAEGGTWSHGVGSKYVWSYYIIMVIKDMVQQLLENIDHLVVIQELV